MATEVVKFYFRHCGTTAALPADDLAEYDLWEIELNFQTDMFALIIRSFICSYLKVIFY